MPSAALATTADEVALLPTLDSLNRTESPLSNGGKWAALNWSGGTQKAGRDTTSGWGPQDAYSTVNGAYWTPTTFKDAGAGAAAAITMQTSPGIENRYVALWLDMGNPGSTKSGYQLRWIMNPGGSTYSVKLVKWSAGKETELASNSSVTIATGTTMAISDVGATVTAWKGTAGTFTSLLTATDSTYSEGYAGIEGSGSNSRSINFKANVLPGTAIPNIAVADSLKRTENPLSNEGKWKLTSWASKTGQAISTGWSSVDNFPTPDGAYWSPLSSSDAAGNAAAITMATGPGYEERSQAIWLNMPTPGSAKSGYRLFWEVNLGYAGYTLKLSKFSAGTETVLAKNTSASIPDGTTLALADTGATVTAWQGTGSTLSLALSASDSTYNEGYAGIEGAGGYAPRLVDFKTGSLVAPPDTSITSGPSGLVFPDVSFAFSSTSGGASFECSIDGGAYASCTSPKEYTALAEGSHTFKVRAKDIGDADPTPAERTFEAIGLSKAVSKVALRDDFERNEEVLTAPSWTNTSWGENGAVSKGAGYLSYSGYGAAHYWNPATFSDASGPDVVSTIVGSKAAPAGQRLVLWLEMPTPGGAKSGYEARFEGVDGSESNYKAELAKWTSGIRTVLASKSAVSLAVGDTMVLADFGGRLELWSGTSSFAKVLSGSDSTYSSGNAGLEVTGIWPAQHHFRAGNIDLQAPDTSITAGPSGKVPPDVSFSLSSTESGSTFECSLDAGAYASCPSPKEYKALSEGSHTFRVRATDNVGNQDATPAERTFEVYDPPETTITSPQPTYANHETWPVTFSSDEAESSFKCSLEAPVSAEITNQWTTTWSTAFSVDFADVNGDGKADIVGRNSSTGDRQVGLSTGSKFNSSTSWGTWGAGSDFTWALADVNGDGRADSVGRSASSGEVRVGLSTGSTFSASSKWGTWDTSYSVDFADLNGDKRADLLGRNSSGDVKVGLSTGSAFEVGTSWVNWSPEFWRLMGDVNGDGKADIVGARNPATQGEDGEEVRVALSTGSSFNSGSTDGEKWLSNWIYTYSFELADVNGDKRADVVGRNSSGQVQVALSDGNEFRPSVKWSSWSTSYSIDWADVNGDGKADVAGRSGSTVQVGIAKGGAQPLSSCTSPYSLPEHLEEGWYTFEAKATDKDGNADPTPARWRFNSGIYPPAPTTSKLVYPEDGKKTASYYTLKAEWGDAPRGGGVTGVSFQMQLPKWKEFRTVPAECVIDGAGEQVSWPLTATSNPGQTEPVFLRVKGCAPFEEAKYPEGEIKFRAVFDGGANAAGASEPVATEFIYRYNGLGAPTDTFETVGPASVDLLTGAFTISRTDVSIPVPGSEATLEFTRNYQSSLRQSGASFLLGSAWQPSTPVEMGYEGEAWTKLEEQVIPYKPPVFEKECWNEEGETVACGPTCPPESCEEWEAEEAQPEERWMELIDNEGGGLSFEISGSSYISPENAKELKLTRETSERIVLADPNGTHTIFIKNGARDYLPKEFSFQASPTSARMVYEKGDPNAGEGLRLSKEIAPSQSGIPCEDGKSIEQTGCRTLKFEYLGVTKWCGLCFPTEVRLASIRYYDATGETSKPHSQVVAEYNYDSEGRLKEEWDPRLPSLVEKYTYNSTPYMQLIASLTPAGEEPWEFDYEFAELAEPYGIVSPSRLKTVSRANPLGGEATTTLGYEVPISGEDAPYNMSAKSVAEWGQSDFPVDATAIFPPGATVGDYSKATVHYMDPDGYEVNTASPQLPGASGPSISTSEVDSKGDTIRSLSAQNRLEALKATDTVARSKELDSHSEYEYGEAGAKLISSQSWGPLHKVRLESGEAVEARAHSTVEYNKGFEPSEDEKKAGVTNWPNLPTKETTGAAVLGKTEDVDVQVSETEYDWTLRKPIKTVVDPGEGHLNVTNKTVYYPKESPSAGLVKEERMPSAAANPNSAGTTKTVYWTVGTNSEQSACGNKAAWAGLPCVTYPAADPSPAESNPKLPWAWYTKYSNLDELEETQEKTNGVLKRTTAMAYDSAGRQVKFKAVGEGTYTVPEVETSYNASTGAPESQQLLCDWPLVPCFGFDNQRITTTYDKLGRPIEYEDADGNKSGIGYDLMGRPVITSDGKGTQTFTYDEKTGVPTKVVDSAAGTFTAAYNADGQMTEQILPNGLAQQITYDLEGTAVGLKYQKISGCSSNCTWLEFNREDSIGGQVLRETGTLATKEYSYDKVGRLTLAKETPAGQGCTTRAYAFDKDSNRTSRITRGPKEGGGCDTESAGTKTSYSYDSADRLVGSGVVYDSLGRITSLPSAYSGGGTLTTSYYANDLTRSQAQDGLTNTYYLDAALRQRERVQSGTKSGTEIYHYAGGSDSPSWTDEGGGAWSRSIGALGGSLGALQKSSGEITFQIADMHGDVVGIADDDPAATKLLSTQQFDEFGNPKQSNTPKFGWLGANSRRTELPSGVIQMGKRSYVPALGRFLTMDPIRGGSANAYDYANQDPVNNFDLTGEKCTGGITQRCAHGLKPKEREIEHRNHHRAKKHHFKSYTGCHNRGCAMKQYEDTANQSFSEAFGGVVSTIFKTIAFSANPTLAILKANVQGYLGELGGHHGGFNEKAWSCTREAWGGFQDVTDLIAAKRAAGYGYMATQCTIGFLEG